MTEGLLRRLGPFKCPGGAGWTPFPGLTTGIISELGFVISDSSTSWFARIDEVTATTMEIAVLALVGKV